MNGSTPPRMDVALEGSPVLRAEIRYPFGAPNDKRHSNFKSLEPFNGRSSVFDSKKTFPSPIHGIPVQPGYSIINP